MTNHRYGAENLLAVVAIAMACGIAPSIAAAQDNPDPGARRPAASRYLPRSAVPGLRDRPRYEVSLPANSIKVTVHYPDAYGYRHAAGAFDADPNSCDAFSVSIVPAGAPSNQPVGVHVEPAMRRASGLYWCNYAAEDLPLNVPIDVRVALADERALPTEAWMDGIEPQPPPGQRRVIGGEARTIVLDNSTPRAALVFWMDYAAQPPQVQRLRQPLQQPMPRLGPPAPEPEFRQFRRALLVPENTPEQRAHENSSAQPMQQRAP